MSESKLYHIYPTMKCNLSCQHCFLHQEVRDQKKMMSNDEFRHIVDMMVKDFSHDNEAEIAEVTIIGGEPALMPPKFYLSNIPYLKEKFKETGKPISLTIVTNLTTISGLKRYAHLFDVVSTSYEWDRFDAQKILTATTDNKKMLWWKNLHEWLDEGRPLAISLATTRETIDNWEAMFEKLYSAGVRFFQVNLMHPDGELMKSILSEHDYKHFDDNRLKILTQPLEKHNFFYKPVNDRVWPGFDTEAQFLKSLTDWLLNKDDNELVIYPINSHLESLNTRVGNSDIACPANGAMCVTTTGQVSGCTIESGKQDMISYGNVFEDSLEVINASPLRVQHLTSLNMKPMACMSCEYHYFCKGGCSFRELFWDSTQSDSECHGLRSYFKYLEGKRIKE